MTELLDVGCQKKLPSLWSKRVDGGAVILVRKRHTVANPKAYVLIAT